jgi:hypothetical protein
MESTADGREIYSTAMMPSVLSGISSVAPQVMTPSPAVVVQEEEDEPSIPVLVDTPCKRLGCGAKFVSQEASRLGEGEGTVCRYHPAPVSQ